MHAITMYREAVNRVPAYRAFLQEKTGGIPEVNSPEDFLKLPFMSKADYIMHYPVAELCLDGDPSCAHLWLRSSGTSRKPFFWPRRYDDERHLPQGLSKLFEDYVTPEVQPTLIVVGLALGPWGTGMQSSYAFRTLAHDVPGLAVVSPGLQQDSIIEVLERLSPLYKRTLLLSYPPFARNILLEAAKRGLDLPALNIHVMVGGEGITESYREMMWDLLGHSERDLNSVWSLYGSTDFANVGFENPLTIATRRIMADNHLAEEILGEPDLPMLFQRIPSPTHFEEIEDELVVSRMQGIPLIRYRSGDRVRFIERDDLLTRMRRAGHNPEQAVREAGLRVPPWTTPFIALYGRMDHAVFYYGAKITVEQVKTALDTPAMRPWFNGRFLIKGIEDGNGNPVLEVSLEDRDELRAANLDDVAETFARQLELVQSEFREVRKLAPGIKHVKIVAAPASLFELGWKTRHL